MSDTPRTSEARKRFLTDLFSGKMMNSRDAWAVAEQLERELAEANKRINWIERASLEQLEWLASQHEGERITFIDKAMEGE
jgi:hypothetical protein